MKYFDGMGRDVTDYVVGLEKTIAELKAQLPAPEKEPETYAVTEDKYFTEEVPVMEEPPKPKTTKKKKVKKVADS